MSANTDWRTYENDLVRASVGSARAVITQAPTAATMNPVDILVAVPTRGLIDYQTVERLNLIRDRTPGLPPIMFAQGVMGAGEVRQRIIADFLDGPAAVLVMVDDDVMPPEDLLGIVEHLDRYDAIAAPTLIYRQGVICWNVDDGDGRWRRDTPSGVVDAVAVGSGCIAIPRFALERFRDASLPVFLEGHDALGMLVESDDVGFCRRANELGLRLGADFGRLCDHRVTVGLGTFVRKT